MRTPRLDATIACVDNDDWTEVALQMERISKPRPGGRAAVPPLVQTIDCLRIPVPNLEAGLTFYRDRLGHELIWRTADAAGLRLPKSETELVLQTQRPAVEIDLLVESADGAAQRVVEAGGAIVVAPFDIPIGRCVVVRDPWGAELVLLDASKGQFITDADGTVTDIAPRT